ncbi:MAG: hypothetical protein ACRD3V_28370 [Vicinamibacteria bacterium]
MRCLNEISAVVLSVLMLVPFAPRGVAADQESLVSQVQIDDALRRASAEEEAARDTIRALLSREDVRDLATSFGLDVLYLDRTAAAVGALDGPELAEAAAYAADLNDQLAGGVTITVSLVALLLIVIIIILLAK